MEDGPPTNGFEDGTIDVERLLVEPQDGHVSVDSVMCFNEKIPKNAMDMEDFSRDFGVTNTDIAREREDILNRDVLGSVSSEVEAGYFRLQNDFCTMGEEYLLGYSDIGFAESITNLDYGSSVGLQTSFSDRSLPASSAGISSPWKSDLYRIMENDQLNVDTSEFGDVPSLCHESEALVEEKPLKSPISCNLQDIGKFHDISSCTFQDILSDGNDTSNTPSVEMFCDPKNEKIDEFAPTGQNSEANKIETVSSRASCSGILSTQKRSRKPTQRYIDELSDPISRYSKKRREVSCPTVKDKSVGVKDLKKCRVGSRDVKLPAEEFSVVAIQVPFGSLVHKECPKSPPGNDTVRSSDRGNPTIKSNDNRVTTQNQKRRDDFTTAVHQKKRDPTAVSQKKRNDDTFGAAHLKKRDDRLTSPSSKKINGGVLAPSPKKTDDDTFSAGHLKKRDDRLSSSSSKKFNGCVLAPSPKKTDNDTFSAAHLKKRDYRLTSPSSKKINGCVLAPSPKKTDDCLKTVRQKKREDCSTEESSEEVSGRRKHHRLWTIAEVKKLIDGVSEYGVGRWSRIKKLLFSTSAHRTSVDLKDKWRNLLKASRMQAQVNQQGEKKRSIAWRPLPKSILRRVCELDTIYPYPKGRKHNKIPHIHNDSPDRSIDITLSDYRRILRSINDN